MLQFETFPFLKIYSKHCLGFGPLGLFVPEFLGGTKCGCHDLLWKVTPAKAGHVSSAPVAFATPAVQSKTLPVT